MKNYLQRNNHEDDWGLNFWDNPFEEFFKPVFSNTNRGIMNTDINQTENGYELSIDMPGFDKKDISVSLSDGYLTVEAKREESDNKKNYLRRERSYSCSRSYYVGEDVTEEDIKAKYQNGTMILDVPNKEPKKITRKNIEIE